MRRNIELKIQKIYDYLEILDDYKVDCKERFLNDTMFEGALLHYLYLVSDSSISLAEMMIKYKNLGLTQSYSNSIDRLGDKGILPREFAYNFVKIASFRNFLAHDYEDVDYLKICDEVLEKLDEIRQYLKYIKEAI
ncbi:MAG: DUF86 domain-containing protein [Campylobacterota bacterium]|nr:DUF86 domain-containing protein [Campylobacterota bacterium]